MSKEENNQFNEGQGDFGLPGDYFQKSAVSILNKIEWQDEHKEFPALLKLKKSNGFIVPENYFVKNEQQLELVDFPNLAAIKKHNPFSVPKSYFEETETILFADKLSDEDNEIQSFEKLSSIARQNNFKTDDHYFSDNEARLITLLETKESAKLTRLFPVKLSYSVAALLVIALGFWVYSFYFKPVEVQDCGTIACIDRIDLVKTKTLENLDNEDLYEIVNTKKLEEKLSSEPVKQNKKTKTDSSSKSDAVDDLLDEI